MKFKYYDKVKVVGGFYEGLVGRVTDYETFCSGSNSIVRHNVNLIFNGERKNTELDVKILANNLEKVEDVN